MEEDNKVFEGQLYFCERFEPDPCYEPASIAMLPDYFSFVVQTSHFRTNKRFKKFLMGIGVSRNLADSMCKMIAKGKGKYQLCYTGYMLAVIDSCLDKKQASFVSSPMQVVNAGDVIRFNTEKEN